MDKKTLDRLFEKHMSLEKNLGKKEYKISSFERAKIKKKVDIYIRQNDIEYNKLKEAFLNKEVDDEQLFYLFTVARNIFALCRAEGKISEKKTQGIMALLSQLPIAELSELYREIKIDESNGVYVGHSFLKKQFSSIMNRKSGQVRALMLDFVRIIFDGTTVARETEPFEEGEEYEGGFLG